MKRIAAAALAAALAWGQPAAALAQHRGYRPAPRAGLSTGLPAMEAPLAPETFLLEPSALATLGGTLEQAPAVAPERHDRRVDPPSIDALPTARIDPAARVERQEGLEQGGPVLLMRAFVLPERHPVARRGRDSEGERSRTPEARPPAGALGTARVLEERLAQAPIRGDGAALAASRRAFDLGGEASADPAEALGVGLSAFTRAAAALGGAAALQPASALAGEEGAAAATAAAVPGLAAQAAGAAGAIPFLPVLYEALRRRAFPGGEASPLPAGVKLRQNILALGGRGIVLTIGIAIAAALAPAWAPFLAALAAALLQADAVTALRRSPERREDVGSSTESADMRMRVGGDGQMRDIRGVQGREGHFRNRLYYRLGLASENERTAARITLAVVAGLALFAFAAPYAGWLFQLAYVILLLAADLYRAARPEDSSRIITEFPRADFDAIRQGREDALRLGGGGMHF